MSVNDAVTISTEEFDAVIFDLDGVVTQTAKVHSAAWKRLFDEFLEKHAVRTGEPFRPFEDSDYLRYVDGKPRYDGVRDFLRSRGISVPEGRPSDPPDAETVCGLGNRKNDYFLAHVQREGVEAFETTVDLIETLRSSGLRTALISASRNCGPILEAAGVGDLFDAKVDGTDLERLGLEGKPAPDVFLEAARQLGVDPSRAVVVEDALAGVEAGRRGGFALVVGVDRVGQAEALREHGAHVVVSDLAQVRLEPG